MENNRIESLKIKLTTLLGKTKDGLQAANRYIDEFFSNPNTSKTSSFIIASIIFASIISFTGSSFLFGYNGEVINDVPVNIVYNQDKYVVSGAPQTAKVSLTGPDHMVASEVNNQPFSLELNLLGYGEGTHIVPIQVVNPTYSSVNYNVEPKFVTIKVDEKEEAYKDINATVINEDKLDMELSVTQTALANSRVLMTGSKTDISNVAYGNALVDLTGLSAGTHIVEAPVYAYDSNANRLTGVTAEPSTVSVEVTIERSFKEVDIIPQFVGTPGDNLVVSSYKLSDKKATIYGPRNVLSNISNVVVPVNVEGKASKFTETATLELPQGLRGASIEEVSIEINFGKKQTKVIKNVPIEFRNLGSGLSASGAQGATTKVDVELIGSSEALENVKASDVIAYVDLLGLGTGETVVDIQATVTSNATIIAVPKVETTTVVIRKEDE